MNLIGTHIGSYVVERELGSGGAGTVYACRHTLIEREVAVKVLHDEHVRDPDQVARFFQEAKAAAEIGHPNIIVIIDYGALTLPSGDRTYVMMESLTGESLDKRMRRGGMSLEEVLHVLNQIASALVACHGKGIVHRDLKPSNVFLCNRSFDPLFVKLLDFGTAKLTAPAPGMRRTQYGMVIGTPAYMSPEQCEGKGAVDHRSDIYSLGCMVYELLTGRVPFGGSIREILLAHLSRTPEPPRALNPAVPPEWEALCLRMLEKPREARFQSVTQVAEALEDLRGHAAAYDAVLLARAASGHSGHTLVATAPGEQRETLRVDVAARSTETEPYAAPGTGAYVSAPGTGAYAAQATGEHAMPRPGEPAAPATGAHMAAPVGGVPPEVSAYASAPGAHVSAPATGEHAMPRTGSHAGPAMGVHVAVPLGGVPPGASAYESVPATGVHVAARIGDGSPGTSAYASGPGPHVSWSETGEHAMPGTGLHAGPATGVHVPAPIGGVSGTAYASAPGTGVYAAAGARAHVSAPSGGGMPEAWVSPPGTGAHVPIGATHGAFAYGSAGASSLSSSARGAEVQSIGRAPDAATASPTASAAAACRLLVEDPRHDAFRRTLMSRPVGRWYEVSEVCQTAHVAPPATLPFDLGLFVCWLEHPYPDPSLAAVSFLSLRSGWSTVVLCGRVR